jgi:hypothetical protein
MIVPTRSRSRAIAALLITEGDPVVRYHYGALLAPVTGEVCLAIARQVQPPGMDAAMDRPLPDRRFDAASCPLDFTR